MITIIIEEHKKDWIPALKMEIGETGIVRESEVYTGHLVLRAKDGFISLTNPSIGWLGPCFKIELCDIRVEVNASERSGDRS